MTVLTNVLAKVIQEAEPTPGVKRYRVAWADRFRFMRDVLGLPETAAGDGLATVARIPHQYPDDPKLYAVEAEFQGEGMATDGDQFGFGHAIVTVTYAEPMGATDAVAREVLK